jgi:amidophosphoribosyltransferase
MCGIIGGFLNDSQSLISSELYEGLCVLQHRGQDAAGIITNDKMGRFYQCKGNGMVRDVFLGSQISNLFGNIGLGHVRYPTAGSSSVGEAQPLYVNSPYGIALSHNGNLTNADELKDYMRKTSHRHINTDSDSELLLNTFAHNLYVLGNISKFDENNVFEAIKLTMQQCRGGYAAVAMIADFGILAFKDVNGIRPLVLGFRKDKKTPLITDYMFSSESVALDYLGYGKEAYREVLPGECILITKNGLHSRRLVISPDFTPCIFEYVYFARPDSIINGISVYRARLAMGEFLAEKIKRIMGDKTDIDVVIPVPDTSRVAALELSYKLGVTYREGFMKNRYVGRTFIMPGQALRKKSVRAKLNPMPMEFHGKNVLLVDGSINNETLILDSIVRGTTSKEIIEMAREAGAKKVYMASCAPPIRYPNVYGIDMPSAEELVASGKTEEEIATIIGADMVIFQDLEDLKRSCQKNNPSISEFEVSVFNGFYITADVSEEYLKRIGFQRRKYKDKESPEKPFACLDSSSIGLFNKFGVI